MHDDDFERGLGQRLRAYESRLPSADAPDTPGVATRRRRRWPAFVLAGGAVAAVAVIAVVALGQPDAPVGDASPTPSPSVGPSSTASASVEESPAASGTDAPSSTPLATEPIALPSFTPAPELAWTQVSGLVDGSQVSRVEDVTAWSGGFVAVGTLYETALPNVGPTPLHEPRIWLSADGHAWESVSPPEIPSNTTLRAIFPATDQRLIAVGVTHRATEFGYAEETGTGWWESADGRTWQPAAVTPPQGWLVDLRHGARGNLALVTPEAAAGYEVWFSPDGSAWELVRRIGDDSVAIGAGDEGFVVIGGPGPYSDEGQDFALASSDGISWLEAEAPPEQAAWLAPRGGDWVAVSHPPAQASLPWEPSAARVWFSANGLGWTESTSVALDAPEVVPETTCLEYPSSFHGVADRLFLSTTHTYPCSEGGFQSHGPQLLSSDGATWQALPFPGRAGGEQRGSLINGVAARNGVVVVVGQSHEVATIWTGEEP